MLLVARLLGHDRNNVCHYTCLCMLIYVCAHTCRSQEARQFWVLDSEATEETKEDWISKLFKLSDNESPTSKGRASPNGKKTKRSNAKGKANGKAAKKACESQCLCNMIP